MDISSLKEKRTHIDDLFPVTVYGFDRKKHTRMLIHWHEDVEIICMKSGKAVFKMDEGLVEVTEGQALFTNSGELHKGDPDRIGADTDFFVIIFNPRVLCSKIIDACETKFILPLLQGKAEFPRTIGRELPWEGEILHALRTIIEADGKKALGYELKIKAALFQLMACFTENDGLIVKDSVMRNSVSDKLTRLKKAIGHIQEHYAKRVTVEELARTANMSKSHFCVFFKANTGMSPVEYLIRHRINEAVALLKNSDCSITEIASRVGFDNVSYFIKTFKGHNGFTPSELRKRM